MATHVYFDLDGTLTDPFTGITRCISYAVDQLGFPPPSAEYLLGCIGPPLYDTFPEMVGEALTLKAVDLYRERFDEVGWQENVPYDGIHDALACIAAAGHSLYVATSKPRIAAQRIVEHFGLAPYFDSVYGCELDGTRSNKVALLKYAIAQNPAAEQRLMIGDRSHDLIGALSNDMHAAGVSYGYGSESELQEAGAMAIAASPAELPALVSKVLAV